MSTLESITKSTGARLSRFIPMTAGSVFLLSAHPCYAHGPEAPVVVPAWHAASSHQAPAHSLAASATVPQAHAHFVPTAIYQPTFSAPTLLNLGQTNLDLSSSSASIALGSAMFGTSGSVKIDLGGAIETFKPGQYVTAAEYVAILQVLSNKPQTLVLTSQGTASGGTFSLNSLGGGKIGELVIPASVTAVDSFSSSRVLTVTGDLINYGTIDGVSTSAKVDGGSISALDIINEAGATITTSAALMPRSIAAGDQKSVSLSLDASTDLANSGSISSSSALTLSTASGSISNSSLVSATAGVTLAAGNGNLTNSGMVQSLKDGISISSAGNPVDLNINATGGSFSAASNINIRDAAYAGTNNINLNGGNYLSQNLNIYGGGGSILGSVDQVSGTLNTSGQAAHFYANSAVLTLGSNQISGDPSYVNTDGDIVINGGVVASEAITILAAGNIIGTGNAYISTANATAPAGSSAPLTDVTLIAGASFTVSNGSNSTTLPAGTPIPLGATASVDFTAAGKGGNIDFSKSTYTGPIINTSSSLQGGAGATNQSANAGNVTLVAESSSSNTSAGRILFPVGKQSITTTSLFGTPGAVTLIAGNSAVSAKTPSIVVGSITTAVDISLNSSTSGTVSIISANAASSDNAPVVFADNGSQTSGNTIVASTVASSGYISLTGSINAGLSSVNIQSAGSGAASGIAQTGTGKITAASVNLQGGALGIGSKTTSILTANPQSPFFPATAYTALSLTSASNVYVSNQGNLSVSGTGGGGGIFQVASTPDINGQCDIVLGNISAVGGATGPLGQITIIGNNVTKSTSEFGALISQQPGTQLTATNVSFNSGGGGNSVAVYAGEVASPIVIQATNFSAKTSGVVSLSAIGPINVLASSFGLGGLILGTTPDGSGNGSITLKGSLGTKSTIITLDSTESGAGVGGIVTNGFAITAGQVELTDTAGGSPMSTGDGNANLGSAAKPIVVDTREGGFASRGDVFITNKSTLSFTQAPSLSGAFPMSGNNYSFTTGGPAALNSLFAAGNLTIKAGGTITLAQSTAVATITEAGLGNISITAGGSAGSILISQTVLAETGNVTLSAGGAGNIQITDSANGVVVGTTGVILNGKGAVFGETTSQPFIVDTPTITSNVTGNTYITTAPFSQVGVTQLNVLATKAAGLFSIVSDYPINVVSPITAATSISLVTTGTGAQNISYAGSLGGTKTTSVLLDAADAGTIAGTNSSAVITGSSGVTLLSNGGNIGSPSTPIQVLTSTLSANTVGATGTVNINALAAKTGTVVVNSASDSDFTLTGTGNISLLTLQSLNGNVSVTTSGALLQTLPGADIQVGSSGTPTSGAATMTLTDNNPKGGSILIGFGSTLQTYTSDTAGTITLQTGTPGTTTAATSVPNVTITGAGVGVPPQLLLGSKGIVANGPTNNINLQGANVVMDTGGLSASHITLNGDTTFIADPPVAAGATTYTSVGPVTSALISSSTPSSLSVVSNGPVTAELTSADLPYAGLNTGVGASPASNAASAAVGALAAFPLSLASNGYLPMAGGINMMPTLTSGLTQQNGIARNSNIDQVSTDWLSADELQSGEIPAGVISDHDLGVAPRHSIALDFSDENNSGSKQSMTSQQNQVGRVFSLRKGSFVVAPKSDTTLHLATGSIKMSAGVLALVMTFDNGFAVYNLDDNHNGSVKIMAAGRTLVLSPGCHLSITSNKVHDFSDINPAQAIGHRAMISQDLGSGLKMFRSEFSAPHAICAVETLRQLFNSKTAVGQKVSKHLLKTIVVLEQLNGGAQYLPIIRSNTRLACR